MKRTLWKVLFFLVPAIILFVWLIKAPVIASYLTDKLGVPVSVGGISLWPNQTSIQGFGIRNPSGFRIKHAFQVEHALIDYNLHSLFATPTEIQTIALNQVFLGIEFSNPLGTSNNWTAIGAGMPNKQQGKEVLIHKLTLSDIVVEIRGLGLAAAPLVKRIDYMEFNEIDSRQGFPTRELIQQIFGTAGLMQYIQDAFNPQKVLDQYLSPLKILGTENEEGPVIGPP